ncbi:3-hydroxyacyl-CoA dehydrogenase family protein [Methanosarcina barkeri]|uniref:3-hydroxyacyl-CoA dehydrogenase family protein n=1 Tax=Methanosarcina barkeri TaxID=2208 RepID=UPI001939660F|nr:3-hydroxyacyl-CoA dehydrogenase NAD-binding domain-containing protein [Methanosarcina barkeri]
MDNEKPGNITIGVIGTGLLGSQISQYMLEYGYPTVIKTRSEGNKQLIFDKIKKKLGKKLTEEEVDKKLEKLQITIDYPALKTCDLIIEASAEDIEVKKEIFQDLSQICRSETIFATNTSSLSIDEIAKSTDRPDKCIGMHFFNPVHKMDLIEIVIGEKTSCETKDAVVSLSTDINKKPIVVKNGPGFIVNRYLLPQINEAILMLEEGAAAKEDIDSAIKLGLNHPMGPFELADFIGLDICLSILEVLSRGLGPERVKPAKLLYKMVEEGKLGHKSGEGFYKY